jgi:diguanylate cyclase (GGDEF)-like protein
MKTNKRKYTVGVLIGNVHSPHTVEVLQGMSEAAKEAEADVIFLMGTHSSHLLAVVMGRTSEVDYDYQFNTIYDYAQIAQLDALVIAYGSLCIFLEDRNRENFLAHFSGIPYILMEEKSDDAEYIIADNYGGMTQMAEHLMRDHGYTKFVYVSGPTNNQDAVERLQAFRDTCDRFGVSFPDDAIEYGNYSQAVWPQVTRLLDAYPDTQAIVCANDEMALGSYEVCKARGLRVGRDIAVTGFDNNMNAQAARIPLTTVEQDGFSMGYQAIANAFKLCKGERIEGHKIPTWLVKRISCGCREDQHLSSPSDLHIGQEEQLDQYAREITRAIIRTVQNQEIFEHCLGYVRDLIYVSYSLITHNDIGTFQAAESASEEILNRFFEGRLKKFVSIEFLREELITWYHMLSTQTDDAFTKTALDYLLLKLQKILQIRSHSDTNYLLQETNHRSWFVQIIIREMTERMDNEKEFYRSAVRELKELGVKSAYIFLSGEVKVHQRGNSWKTPEVMYLAAYHRGEMVRSYQPKNRPIVTKSSGFSGYLQTKGGHQYYSYILFSQERQYGILLCEIEPDDISILYFASLQIGTAMRFLELHKEEKEDLRIIREQNTVLSFISEKDSLTGLYNRKGFMEHALKMNRLPDYQGEKAIFIYADLDHLKEINDIYGHNEGDYAIRKAGETLKSCLSGQAVVGRIGGDEYVAIDIARFPYTWEALQGDIQNAFASLNAVSEKPYYIELSVGYYRFNFGEEEDFVNIMAHADKSLYKNKLNRRESVTRSNTF